MTSSLSDLINAQAEHDGQATALLAPGRVPLSYANLYQQIQTSHTPA